MKPYVVRAGDHLGRLALELRFNADEVWNDPQNRHLHDAGRTPDMLVPGDILYVPTTAPESLSVESETTNRYRAQVPTVRVGLILQDALGQPLANRAYTVEGVPGAERSGTTDGEGALEVSAPAWLRDLRVNVEDGPSYVVAIGHLDPLSERSGLVQRLTHLGLLPKLGQAPSDEQLEDAIRQFQIRARIDATGELDDRTREELERAHGC
jgi:hypothetical protein